MSNPDQETSPANLRTRSDLPEDQDFVQDAVRKRREMLGLTQGEAARQAGISLATWRRIETGERISFRPDTLDRVERVLRLPRGGVELLRQGFPPQELELVEFRPKSSKDRIQKYNRSFRGDSLTPLQAHFLGMGPREAQFSEEYEWKDLLKGETTADRVGPFSQLPDWVLFSVNNVWLSRFRDTYIGIERRLDAGQVPYPRCVAEEVALWIALDEATELMEDALKHAEGDYADLLREFDSYGQRDHDWDVDALFQDLDFQEIWRTSSPYNHLAVTNAYGIDPSDYHPFNWWRPFTGGPWQEEVSTEVEPASED